MASATPGTDTLLQMKRVFNAPRETVFDAWTDPEKLNHWFCKARPGGTGRVTELDLRPGGHYRVEVNSPDGKHHLLRGEYKEIDRPRKLVFSWGFDTDPQYGDTVITLEFVDMGGKTELILTQGNFPTKDARDAHNNGWNVCFDSLDRYLGL
jgi:uncharacterized protein YndB with AHSA1/START domain